MLSTKTRWPLAAALLLLLAACGSSDDAKLETAAAPAAKPAGPNISNADAAAVRDQIYPNWLAPDEPPCHTPLKVRIDLAEDGRVVRAEAKPELGYDDPCRPTMDSAIRAVWAASPLRLPRTRTWQSLTLVFDKDAAP
jgi:hypothetical protein